MEPKCNRCTSGAMDQNFGFPYGLGYSYYNAMLLSSLKPRVEIEGNLILPKGKKFALVTRGVEEGTLLAKNNEGKTYDPFACKKL